MLHGEFDQDAVALARKIKGFGIKSRLIGVEITCKIGDAALVTVGNGIRLGRAH